MKTKLVYIPLALQISGGLPNHITTAEAQSLGAVIGPVTEEWEQLPPPPLGDGSPAGAICSADWTAFDAVFRGVEMIDAEWVAAGWPIRPSCAAAACRKVWETRSWFPATEYTAPPADESTGSGLGDMIARGEL